MNRKPWVRPLLAFAISFGVLALIGAVIRSALIFQHLFALGTNATDSAAINQVVQDEALRLNKWYALLFLVGALLIAGVFAAIFAAWRPVKKELPPPLPHG